MSLDQIYSQQIKAWAKQANQDGRLDDFDVSLEKRNPTCGSKVSVTINFKDQPKIGIDARRACLLTQAATQALLLGPSDQIEKGAEQLQAVLAGETRDLDPGWAHLETFAPVAAFRARHSSIMLPFNATLEAVRSRD